MRILGKVYYWGDKAKHVPEEPGVYAFYDKDGSMIYIGKSVNLRKDFTLYLETNFSSDSCKCEAKYYKREFTSKQDARMKALLQEYRQIHGKPPKCNHPLILSKKEVASKRGFYFYKEFNKPLHKAATSLQDLKKKISEVPIVSLEFHQKRGDFANWIKVVLKAPYLAGIIQKIDRSGEDLRRAILNALNNSESAQCPICKIETSPVKTWKMAGKPSKTGERLQLTIGHYKCHKCNKTFRQVLAKTKIKAS